MQAGDITVIPIIPMIVAIKSRSQCGGVGRLFVARVKQMVRDGLEQ